MSRKGINILNDIHTILFPRVCFGCNAHLLQGERYLCTVCRHHLPLTYFHRVDENDVMKVFYGRVLLKKATSFLFFEKKGPVRELIHYLKYKNQKEIGCFLGDWMGQELKQISDYRSVDIVIPVPLHPKKLKQRGYNQTHCFGKELARHLDALFLDRILIKTHHTPTQTTKKRITRWYYKKGTYTLTDTANLLNKHILLVDDIITTGATLEACSKPFQEIPGVTLSVASMAFTH